MTIYFNSSASSLPIQIESIGNHWPQVSLQRPQGYPFYHWLQSEKGTGEIWIDNQTFKLNEGEGILLSPFVPHGYYPISEIWETNFLTFDGILKHSFHEFLANKPYVFAKNQPYFSYSETINEMIHVLETAADPVTLSILCYSFLVRIGQSYEPVQNNETFQRFIAPSVSRIQAEYEQELTVEQLAQDLFISPQYFSRLFKKFMGQSPYQYLLEYRIRRAKELLINEPEQSIQFIANRVGFDSTSQFIDLFKRRTKFTPKKFRALYVNQSSN